MIPRQPKLLLYDSIQFEDALGRVARLPHLYFQHWEVGHVSSFKGAGLNEINSHSTLLFKRSSKNALERPDSIWRISYPEENQETTTKHRESRMESSNNPRIEPLYVCSARQATYHGSLVPEAPMQRDMDIAKRVLRGTVVSCKSHRFKYHLLIDRSVRHVVCLTIRGRYHPG